jgi:PDZ domain
MRRALLFLGLGLVGGFAVSAWWSGTTPEVAGLREPVRTDARVIALERELTAEVESLRRELAELRADVTRLGDAPATGESAAVAEPARARAEAAAERAGAAPGAIEATPPADLPFPPGGRFRMRSSEGRIDALTEAGFALDRAQQIERRVEELRVAAMQARYEAARGGASANAPIGEFFDTSATLRSELGDADYERYLTALGQPTRVDVVSVLSSSAAEQAGVEAGDQIVSYGGQRVFDVRELNRAMLVGEPGEPVVVDIVRAGQPMQLVLPRGPLGITGGFAGRGRPQ